MQLRDGILGKQAGMANLTEGGMSTSRIHVRFSPGQFVETVDGYDKYEVHIPGDVLNDAVGVLHAGALRIESIEVTDNLPDGIIAVLECAGTGEGSYTTRPLPSACRTTLLDGAVALAGNHVSGFGTAPSKIDFHTLLAENIPGCRWAVPCDSAEAGVKSDHLSIKWWDRIGTALEDISHSCKKMADSKGEQLFIIPLKGDDPCCLAKFATDLWVNGGTEQLKLKEAFDSSSVVCRDPINGQAVLRISGEKGNAKVQEACKKLSKNIEAGWGHHGFIVRFLTKEQGDIKGTANIMFNRRVTGEVHTTATTATRMNIAVPQPVMAAVAIDAPSAIAQADMYMAQEAINQKDAVVAMAQPAVTVYQAAAPAAAGP
jgi:hypothetical protein